MRQTGAVSQDEDVRTSVLLVVGREQFTPPRTFAGATCTATQDCLAVAVSSPPGVAVPASFAARSPGSHLSVLGTFTLESEGLLSLRDVYNRELESVGVDPGLVDVTVLGDDPTDPGELVLVVAPAHP